MTFDEEMRIYGIIVSVVCGMIICSCSKTEWTKQEATQWCDQNKDFIRGGIGYFGTDERWHYYMARSMDTWVTLKIPKDELKISEEKLHRAMSSDFLGYYAVDPNKNFSEVKNEIEQSHPPNPQNAGG